MKVISQRKAAWLALIATDCRQTVAIIRCLSRGDTAFAGRRGGLLADSDVSTSTRRVAGSVLTVALASSQNRLFTVLAQPPQVMSSIWNCIVNSFIVGTVASLEPCRQCWKVKRNLQDLQTLCQSVATGRRNTTARYAPPARYRQVVQRMQNGTKLAARRRRSSESALLRVCAMCCMFWIRLSSSSILRLRGRLSALCRSWLFKRFSKSLISKATEKPRSRARRINAID